MKMTELNKLKMDSVVAIRKLDFLKKIIRVQDRRILADCEARLYDILQVGVEHHKENQTELGEFGIQK